MYYAIQQKNRKAISNLKTAIQLGFDDLEWLELEGSLDGIRDDVGFLWL